MEFKYSIFVIQSMKNNFHHFNSILFPRIRGLKTPFPNIVSIWYSNAVCSKMVIKIPFEKYVDNARLQKMAVCNTYHKYFQNVATKKIVCLNFSMINLLSEPKSPRNNAIHLNKKTKTFLNEFSNYFHPKFNWRTNRKFLEITTSNIYFPFS